MRRTLSLVLIVLALLLLRPLSVHAHAVHIFAWADGDRICSESYFSRKNKVRGGAVHVRSAAGETLAQGRTDQGGLWCFPAPAAQDLHFTLMAGQGHRAEFVLPATHVPDGASHAPAASGAERQRTETPDPDAQPPARAGQGEAQPASLEVLRAVVRESVREELQTQLSPIRRALAERQADTGPTARDIAGGLGWIIGLAGLAAWYSATRRKR